MPPLLFLRREKSLSSVLQTDTSPSLRVSCFTEIPVKLDAAILSDDYVLQSYGGFFTGAFVGLAVVDYSGYEISADFYDFAYQELGDRLTANGAYSWEASESRFN